MYLLSLFSKLLTYYLSLKIMWQGCKNKAICLVSIMIPQRQSSMFAILGAW